MDPDQNVHAFMYALDLDGNWQWGKFFYNNSVAIRNITGCNMASNGQSLTVLGMANTSHPVIMDIRTRDGTVDKFTYIKGELIDSYIQADLLQTFGAVYRDNKDPLDGLDYTYVSFLTSNYTRIVRILNTDSEDTRYDYDR